MVKGILQRCEEIAENGTGAPLSAARIGKGRFRNMKSEMGISGVYELQWLQAPGDRVPFHGRDSFFMPEVRSLQKGIVVFNPKK
jgi:hypothetical protein